MVFSGQDKFCLTMILIFPQSDALFRFYHYFKLLILASGIYLTTDFSQKSQHQEPYLQNEMFQLSVVY